MNTPVNRTRAAWADEAVLTFAETTGITDEDAAIQFGDLLASMIHWARAKNVDVPGAIQTGLNHAFCEIADEEGGVMTVRCVSRRADALLSEVGALTAEFLSIAASSSHTE